MKLIQLAAVATVVGIAVPFAATRGATFTTPERIDVFNNWDTDTGTATTTTSFTSNVIFSPHNLFRHITKSPACNPNTESKSSRL